jgi:DUF4097 and DUF4098 domain-containing protein YvlB
MAAVPNIGMAGGGSVDRKVTATANGEVVISNVSGTVDVRGWDRNEVQVTGHLDDDVERLEFETSGGRTVIKVIVPRGGSHDSSATLEVQVPKMSTVEVSAVSADVSSRGVLGTQRIKTVSGEVTADVSGNDSEIGTVSGDLTVRSSGKPISLRVTSVSGSLDLSNGAGKLDVVTVSGDARVQMVEASGVRGRTTSGDLDLRARLTRDARVELEAVSGDLSISVPGTEGLSADVESFSGDIHGCLAQNVERVSKYGPGVRLNIRAVESGAYVRAKTLSGDIDVCDR